MNRMLIMTGRCRTATDGSGRLSHIVDAPAGDFNGGFGGAALCGAKPGKASNGWSDYPAKTVTCPKCLAKIEAMKHDREGNW